MFRDSYVLRNGLPLTFVALLLLFINAQIGNAQPCAPFPSCLVSWWPAEGHELDIQDSNHGTPHGGIGYAAGMVGLAFDLDGIDDYVEVSDAANLDLGSTFTIEVWVNPGDCDTGYSGVNPVITKESPTQFDCYSIGFYNGDWYYGATTTGAGPDLVLSGGGCTPGTWIHLAVTQDGTTTRFYIDGAEVGNGPAVVPLNTALPLTIGWREDISSSPGLTTAFFHGLIDEVTIYDCALSAADIQGIYAAGSAGKCVGLIPTLSQWGAIILGFLLLGGLVWFVWRMRDRMMAAS